MVGQKIREIRKSRRITQAALASQIGVTQSDLSRMENGEYKVGLDVLFKILQVFDLSLSGFFDERPAEPAEPQRPQDDEEAMLENIRTLPEESRREVREFIEFKKMQALHRGRRAHELNSLDVHDSEQDDDA